MQNETEKVELGETPTPKKVTKKKVTKKKVAKKKSLVVVPKEESTSSLFDTFDEWWKKNTNTHQNICVKLLVDLGRPDLKYSKIRRDFGFHLSEKDLCEKVFDSYAY